MKRYVLALDLKDDPGLIARYEAHHREVWPEIKASILESGILRMEIYRSGNRLCMVLDTTDNFSLEQKARQDAENSKVGEWERLMDTFQQRLPWAAPGEKWTLMHPVYQLEGR